MQLVTHPRCFEGYPLSLLPRALVKQTSKSPFHANLNTTLLRLQCFCEITGADLRSTGKRQLAAALNEFAAALFSKMFLRSDSRPWSVLFALRRALPTGVILQFPSTFNRPKWPKDFRRRVDYYDQLKIDPEKLDFWRGWVFRNAGKRAITLILWRFWKTFGQDRAGELIAAVRTHQSTGHFDSLPVVQFFIDTCLMRPDINFRDSAHVGETLLACFESYYRSGYQRGLKLSTLRNNWRAFAYFLNTFLLGSAWGAPIPAMPLPARKTVSGTNTNVETTDTGHTIKVSLMTPVPLQVTDTQAKELLFRDIQSDVETLLVWAREEVKLAKERMQARQVLASKGVVRKIPNTKEGHSYVPSFADPDYLANAAATFEIHGFNHLIIGPNTATYYPRPPTRITWELGLPTPRLLLAYAALLINQHPAITPAFLQSAELYDSDGIMVGLHQTDAGWYLRSAKPRRGPRLAQQDILLTADTLEIVRDIIATTEPLRTYLRSLNHPEWRRLFLATAHLGKQPRSWSPDKEAHSGRQWVTERICELAHVSRERAAAIAERFTLRKLRSSRAVLIYIETGSVEQMAKALGHENWLPTLLDHYLPRPIQEFFTERWIRLFQTGILCEALRDSPYLLQASDFHTMDELDQFLENHALRQIPAHLENPDEVGGSRKHSSRKSQVIFGIDIGILTILISLIAAVRTASGYPCGRAMRWARIGERLVSHLDSQSEQPEFHAVLTEARRLAQPAQVARLIYG